jgi:hypothetical protein
MPFPKLIKLPETLLAQCTRASYSSAMSRIYPLILVMLLSGSVAFAVDPSPFFLRQTNTASFGFLQSVLFTNSQFVVMGYGIVQQSADGVSWQTTVLTNGFELGLRDVVYADGHYVAVGGGEGGNIRTSVDGTNWTLQRFIGAALRGVTYGSNGFVAVEHCYPCGTTSLETSPDGTNWTSRSSGLGNSSILNSVAYGNGIYAAVGSAIVASPNGTNWAVIESANSGYLNRIIFTNSSFTAVGNGGVVRASGDGIHWVTRTMGIAADFYGLTFANDTYVAVGSGGAIAYSTNRVNWIKAQPFTTTDLYGICYGDGTFVLVGYNSLIMQSRDFLRPHLGLSPASNALDLLVPSPEFGRQYRIEASPTATFDPTTTLLTYSNSHTNIIVRDYSTNASRFYRVVSP